MYRPRSPTESVDRARSPAAPSSWRAPWHHFERPEAAREHSAETSSSPSFARWRERDSAIDRRDARRDPEHVRASAPDSLASRLDGPSGAAKHGTSVGDACPRPRDSRAGRAQSRARHRMACIRLANGRTSLAEASTHQRDSGPSRLHGLHGAADSHTGPAEARAGSRDGPMHRGPARSTAADSNDRRAESRAHLTRCGS
jgi:hypothetical protein